MELGWEEDWYIDILWGCFSVDYNCLELTWLLSAETLALKCEDMTHAVFSCFTVY